MQTYSKAIGPMLSLQKWNDPTVKCVPYQTIWLTFFNRLICSLTEAVSPFLFLRRQAQSWYSLQIEKQMKEEKKAREINVDSRISIMNPLHAKRRAFHSMIIWKIIVTSSWLDGENLKMKKFSIGHRKWSLFVNNIEKVIFGWKRITGWVENDYSFISYDSFSIICAKILNFLHLREN